MTTERKVPELSLLSYIHGNSTEQAKFVDQFFLVSKIMVLLS
jgi:hypothetical protein